MNLLEGLAEVGEVIGGSPSLISVTYLIVQDTLRQQVTLEWSEVGHLLC